MHEIGWTDAATFQKGKVQVLDHAILRYHAYAHVPVPSFLFMQSNSKPASLI